MSHYFAYFSVELYILMGCDNVRLKYYGNLTWCYYLQLHKERDGCLIMSSNIMLSNYIYHVALLFCEAVANHMLF